MLPILNFEHIFKFFVQQTHDLSRGNSGGGGSGDANGQGAHPNKPIGQKSHRQPLSLSAIENPLNLDNVPQPISIGTASFFEKIIHKCHLFVLLLRLFLELRSLFLGQLKFCAAIAR